MDYKAEAENCYEALVKAIESDDWGKEIKSSKENKVYRKKSDHFYGNVYKCLYTVEMSMADFIALSVPKCLGGNIEDVDALIKELQSIEDISDNMKLVRSVTTSLAMGLISPREFIDIVYIKRFEDNEKKAAIIVKGVEHDSPVGPKLVRGKHYNAGMIFEAVKLDGKEVIEVKQIEELDFSGSVPSSVIDRFIPGELFGRGGTLKKNLKKLNKIRGK